MTKPILAALAAALVLVPAALASDPSSALTADLQKLSTDRAAMHATVLADIQKLTADAQAAAGSNDKSSVKSTLQADVQKLNADLRSGAQTMQVDRRQTMQDLQAAKQAGVKLGSLKTQLQQLKQLFQQDKAAAQQDLQAAKQALDALKQSFHK
jgi:hypothetical protein